MYKIINLYGKPAVVIRLEDGASVPFDPANTDYQVYLKWVEAGNTPESADEQSINKE